MVCKARQYSDQLICDQCGLQWDINDPDPPECGRTPTASNIGCSTIDIGDCDDIIIDHTNK